MVSVVAPITAGLTVLQPEPWPRHHGIRLEADLYTVANADKLMRDGGAAVTNLLMKQLL